MSPRSSRRALLAGGAGLALVLAGGATAAGWMLTRPPATPPDPAAPATAEEAIRRLAARYAGFAQGPARPEALQAEIASFLEGLDLQDHPPQSLIPQIESLIRAEFESGAVTLVPVVAASARGIPAEPWWPVSTIEGRLAVIAAAAGLARPVAALEQN